VLLERTTPHIVDGPDVGAPELDAVPCRFVVERVYGYMDPAHGFVCESVVNIMTALGYAGHTHGGAGDMGLNLASSAHAEAALARLSGLVVFDAAPWQHADTRVKATANKYSGEIEQVCAVRGRPEDAEAAFMAATQ